MGYEVYRVVGSALVRGCDRKEFDVNVAIALGDSADCTAASAAALAYLTRRWLEPSPNGLVVGEISRFKTPFGLQPATYEADELGCVRRKVK